MMLIDTGYFLALLRRAMPCLLGRGLGHKPSKGHSW